jgi:tetratricopeptide (TPR) repeat protein
MRRPAIATLLLAAFALSPHEVRAQTADDCYQATLKVDDAAIIRICSQALDKGGLSESDRSITLSNRGLGYLRNKEYDKSIIDFSDALLINAKNAYAFNSRGDAWLQKSNYERALADFDEALKVDSAFTGAIYNRGLTFERQGNLKGAIEEYRKAIATTNTRALDNWSRDRARERLAALGENPQPQRQRQDDSRPSERQTDRQPDQKSNPGRGNDGSYIRRK